MKLNWGTYVVVVFGAFIAFILYFVVKVQSSRQYDNELVVEEYYKNDARFGEEFAKLQNTQQLAQPPQVEVGQKGVTIAFPEQFNPDKLEAKVSFYRPSAKKLDFTESLRLSGASVLIPKEDLVGGRWDMTLSWQYAGKEYLLKKQIYIN